jgi:hypothetical protein
MCGHVGLSDHGWDCGDWGDRERIEKCGKCKMVMYFVCCGMWWKFLFFIFDEKIHSFQKRPIDFFSKETNELVRSSGTF